MRDQCRAILPLMCVDTDLVYAWSPLICLYPAERLKHVLAFDHRFHQTLNLLARVLLLCREV